MQTVKLNRGGKIVRGQVMTPDGKPIADATISTGTYYTNTFSPSVKTDADGRFEIWGLPQSLTTLSPTTSCDDFVTNSISLGLNAKGPTDVTLTLYPAAAVTGTVVSKETGRLISNVKVIVGTVGFGGYSYSETTTDQAGRYRLSGVGRGTLYAHTFSDDFAPSTQTITTEYGVTSSANFELETGKSVTGTITDLDGNPIPQVYVVTNSRHGQRMFERSAYTNTRGEFTLEHMPSTEVEVHVTKDEYVSVRNLNVKGGETMDLTLQPIITHTITIRDAGHRKISAGPADQ